MRCLWIAWVGVVGCASGPMYTMSVSATSPLTAKPASCEFKVVALAPTGDGYEEIAILSPQQPSWVAGDPDSFKKEVRSEVCRVGGDLVVTDVNGHGSYVRGTVLRERNSSRAAQP